MANAQELRTDELGRKNALLSECDLRQTPYHAANQRENRNKILGVRRVKMIIPPNIIKFDVTDIKWHTDIMAHCPEHLHNLS